MGFGPPDFLQTARQFRSVPPNLDIPELQFIITGNKIEKFRRIKLGNAESNGRLRRGAHELFATERYRRPETQAESFFNSIRWKWGCHVTVGLRPLIALLGPDNRRIDMVFFDHNPAAELEKFPARAHGPDWRGENSVEEIQKTLSAEEFVGLVVVEDWLPQIFEVQFRIVVNFGDAFHERLFVREIEIVQETFWIEFLVNPRTTPVNRDAPCQHRLIDFLRCVTGNGFVLKAEVEFIRTQKILLADGAAGDWPADIVQRPPARIHLLVAAQAVEEFNPLLSVAMGVTDDKRAEFCFTGQHLFGRFRRRHGPPMEWWNAG